MHVVAHGRSFLRMSRACGAGQRTEGGGWQRQEEEQHTHRGRRDGQHERQGVRDGRRERRRGGEAIGNGNASLPPHVCERGGAACACGEAKESLGSTRTREAWVEQADG